MSYPEHENPTLLYSPALTPSFMWEFIELYLLSCFIEFVYSSYMFVLFRRIGQFGK